MVGWGRRRRCATGVCCGGGGRFEGGARIVDDVASGDHAKRVDLWTGRMRSGSVRLRMVLLMRLLLLLMG